MSLVWLIAFYLGTHSISHDGNFPSGKLRNGCSIRFDAGGSYIGDVSGASWIAEVRCKGDKRYYQIVTSYGYVLASRENLDDAHYVDELDITEVTR